VRAGKDRVEKLPPNLLENLPSNIITKSLGIHFHTRVYQEIRLSHELNRGFTTLGNAVNRY